MSDFSEDLEKALARGIVRREDAKRETVVPFPGPFHDNGIRPASDSGFIAANLTERTIHDQTAELERRLAIESRARSLQLAYMHHVHIIERTLSQASQLTGVLAEHVGVKNVISPDHYRHTLSDTIAGIFLRAAEQEIDARDRKQRDEGGQ